MTLLLILALLLPADSLSEWQDEILSRLDDETIDRLGEEGMQQYMGLLEDLEFQTHEPSARYRQEVMIHADACLSLRDGYRNRTRQRILANKVYLGDPIHESVRWKASYGSWKATLTADKDAGERLGNGSFTGFALWQKNADCKILVGDYRVVLGTGLILNQNFSLGKQLMQAVFFRRPNRLTGHSSTDEYNHMRGVAAEWRWGRVRAMAFASVLQADGRVTRDTLRTLYTDGYHRTNAEVEHARQVLLWQGGARVAWRGDWYEVGGNVRTLVTDPLWYRSVQRYNRNYFRGRSLTSASLDWAAQRWGVKARGETAVDDGGGLAAQAAFSLPLGEDWTTTLQGRWYANDYRSVDGSGIAESGAMQGERGLFVELDGQISRHWSAGLWIDWFKFTQPQYHIPQPSGGLDAGLQASYKRKTWSLTAQYRAKLKAKTDASTTDTEDILRYVLHSVSATALWQILSPLRVKGIWRSRIYSQQKAGYAASWLVSGSVQWNAARHGWMTEVQATWFAAPDYNARLYLSERSLRYGFLVPMLQGTGLRFSATGRLQLPLRLTLEAKYALTEYKDTDHIGSGLQRIEGNVRHDLWLQLSHTF